MNKKRLIQIIVIICAFVGSGIVLYNGFFKNSAPPPLVGPSGSIATAVPGAGNGAGVAGGNSDQILPNGGGLNLDIVNRPNVTYDTLSLPMVNPNREVGIDESLLIIPLPKQNTGSGGLLKNP